MTAPSINVPGAMTPGTVSQPLPAGGLLHRLSNEQGRLRTRSTAMLVLAAMAVLIGSVAVGIWLLGNGRWMAFPRALPFLVWMSQVA